MSKMHCEKRIDFVIISCEECLRVFVLKNEMNKKDEVIDECDKS